MSSAGAESAAAVGTESTDADRRSGHAERRNTAALAAGLAATTAVVALGLLPAVASALPQDISPPRALVAGEDFAPRKPGFEGLDWILLNSGEWLRGSVDRIRDESLEFDSEELDSLNLDFADVYAVVTAGPHTVNLEGRRIVTGEVVIRDDVLRLRTAEGVLTFPRAEIVGMVSGEQRERNYWSGTVSVGLSLQRGNTNT